MTSTKPTESESLEPKPDSFRILVQLFFGGCGAGLIAFAIFGGIWQVTHFWWVMLATTISCGLLAVLLRQPFKKMLSALMDTPISGI
ncbi:MAG: hypothetical protein ACFBSC_19730 [Microcoleaceae cyanobacterium]